MKDELNELVKKFIEGEWLYNDQDKTLKKTFASDAELSELDLIDDDGYLNPELKTAVAEALGEKILSSIVGPFGDSDIFSGDMLDDEVLYNLELHKVSQDTLDALQSIPDVTIKKVDASCE